MEYPKKPERASAKAVIELITGNSDPQQIDEAIDAHLKAQLANAKIYQEANGVTFDLTFDGLKAAVTPSRRRKMAQQMIKGRFQEFMESSYGYVITWKNKAAFQSRVLDASTVAYLNRDDSKRVNHFTAGDTHSEKSKDMIRQKRLGTTQKAETKAKISKTKTGVAQEAEHVAKRAAALTGKSNTDETKAKKAEAAKARWAKVRAEKEANEDA